MLLVVGRRWLQLLYHRIWVEQGKEMEDWMKKKKVGDLESSRAGVLRQWEGEGWEEVLCAMLIDD
jgi:hypothetical protein